MTPFLHYLYSNFLLLLNFTFFGHDFLFIIFSKKQIFELSLRIAFHFSVPLVVSDSVLNTISQVLHHLTKIPTGRRTYIERN